VFSSPWSLEFVVAVILGAMLVPGCRPADGPKATAPPQVYSGQLGSKKVSSHVTH
jgi:hypothetical protein